MSDIDLRIEKLSENKRKLLARALQNNWRGRISRPIQRRPGSSFAPLSFEQQRIWFLHELHNDSTAYNMTGWYRLRGQLNVRELARSFIEIVRRHEVLRTRFQVIDEEARQVVDNPSSFVFSVIDLCELPDSDSWNIALDLAKGEAQRPFDLTLGPALRTSLMVAGKDDYILLFAGHHIIMDGISLGIFRRELQSLYQSYINGEVPKLADLPIQYGDFSIWQREKSQADMVESGVEYWARQLAGAPSYLNLPVDQSRPLIQTFRGETKALTFSSGLSASVKALSVREGTTLFMTMLAILKCLLFRYTGQDDIVVGTAVAGREREELRNLIGLFINSLALRSRLSKGDTFHDLLKAIRLTTVEAYSHQEVPFEKVVERLRPARYLDRAPIFQVMFISAIEPEEFRLPGVELRRLSLDNEIAKFDLTVTLWNSEDKITLFFEYNTDLFDALTISRMQCHLQVIMEAIVTQADQPVSRLPLLTGAERHQVLRSWNATLQSFPSQRGIHHLFEDQVAIRPFATALRDEEGEISYHHLNARANRLANYLRYRGVGPEVCVGVCLERSCDLIVGLLGILKAGGAYLPLDPGYPSGRLEFMLNDAQVPVLLTQQSLLERLPAGGAEVIRLDRDWELIARAGSDNPVGGSAGANLAYVIYTSGSTGTPKGVAIEHRNAVNFICWARRAFASEALERTLFSTSLNFDLAVFELFAPLCVGGTVRIVANALDLARETVDVTLINTVPTAMTALVEGRNVPATARVVNLAGEPLKKALVEEIFETTGVEEVCNLYGPTETTTYSTWVAVSRGETFAGHIGRPIANTQVYILDECMEPAPVGVIGEIYIGGEGVARGYLSRAELTAERFLPDPYGAEGGGRLYRSGDLGRYLRDGRIECLGRSDHQVKVRGYRIELGEIEAALREHAGVREAVVTAREDGKSERRLVGYVVEKERGELSISDLRRHLKERLPDYMIPAGYVFLQELPLTPNGKLDRNALPAPEPTRAELAQTYLPARTPLEEIIAMVWSAVLGMEKIGVQDNFFDLGGHSLLAMQAVSRVEEIIKTRLPLRTLFEAPTLAEFAIRADILMKSDKSRTVPPIKRIDRGAEVPLSFQQQRIWFLQQLNRESAVFNVPVAFRMLGSVDIKALTNSFNEVARRHEVLRASFLVVNEQIVQVIDDSVSIAIPVIDLSGTSETDRECLAQALIKIEASRPFELGQGPLFRVHMLRLKDEAHIILFTIHHIVSDGWSMGIIMSELSAAYNAYLSGQPSPLKDPSIRYADYVYWQRELLQGETLNASLSYWVEHLGNAPTLQLPIDRPRPAVVVFRGERHPFSLPRPLSVALKSLARNEGATLFMTLLAAFQSLLHRYSGQSDIVVGAPIANRDRSEIEELVGLFINVLVMRTNFTGAPGFHEILRRVREVSLNAFSRQETPFEKIVEALQPVRNLSHSPLFQAAFVMQPPPRRELGLTGLTLNQIEVRRTVTNYDLTLQVFQAEEEIHGALEYNSFLFDKATIEQIGKHLQVIMEAIVTQADQPVSRLPLLTGAERHQVLRSWNATLQSFPSQRGIHHLFEDQVAIRPFATALRDEEGEISYHHLNARANRLANYLRYRGVGPEVCVGVCLERSCDLMVGLLGILKAGGAYLPLDPGYPSGRLEFMLNDAQVPVLLTQQSLLERLPAGGAEIICLDRDWELIARAGSDNLCGGSAGANLAYVIYTSGSTGAPKGVQVSHANVINFLCSMRAEPGLEEDDVMLAITSLSFDIAGLELLLPLAVGARIELGSRGVAADAERLMARLGDGAVSVMQATPATYQMLLQAGWEGNPRLKALCGGEKLSCELAEELFGRTGELWNMYGPTETTVWSTTILIEAGEGEITIGRPVANTQVYILDECMEPAPVGVIGEVYIGGEGVARGYLSRAELTAERFLPDPHGAEGGGRLYRSGDLGRYLRDGRIECLGRSDHQVKVRGYRIELGEIEAALREHAGVRESVVTAREDGKSERRLVGYVVEKERGELSISDLRRHLKERLPDYMIPAGYVFLQELPLTPNGKLDRKALPAQEPTRADLDSDYTAPQSEVEHIVADIWRQVLNLEEVGVQDNFFDLGGHSLLLVRILTKLREHLRCEIAMVDLFEHTTIRSLSMFLTRNPAESNSVSKSPVMDRQAQSMKIGLNNLLQQQKRASMNYEKAQP